MSQGVECVFPDICSADEALCKHEPLAFCRLGEKVSHYASLIFAEKPLEAQKQYKRRRSSIAAGQLPPDVELGTQVSKRSALLYLHLQC